MDPLTCRLLPFADADGPTNMAADEALLRSAQDGVASLRFYTWAEPTASLGYFQPATVLQGDARVARLPWLRRPSGGLTLVHHRELTYALALPAGRWQEGGSWLPRMHGVIASALASLGVEAQPAPARCVHPTDSFLCFHHFTCGDLLLGNAKIVGSSQRKQRGALLQHGALLLAQSEHTPTLPGIAELTGRSLGTAEVVVAVRHAFEEAVGRRLVEADWTATERQITAELIEQRFTRDNWNRKR